MSESRRVQRVERELREIVARYLLKGLSTPVPGLVSISRVQATKELRTAKVFVSVMGSEDEKEEAFAIVEDHIREIQKDVNSKLRMKFVPKIQLVLDKGFEHMMKVESLLHQIGKEQTSKDQTSKENSDSDE